jgi:RNA polymerase sigma-70 factor (ECF subfamily)
MLTTAGSLLDQLRQPDHPDAWPRFVRLYAPLLLHWAGRHGLQPADAADVAQDVLLKLRGRMAWYRREPGQTFRGWLYRLVANQCHDFRRRVATRPLPGADGLAGAATPAGDPDEREYRVFVVREAMELVRPRFTDRAWAMFRAAKVDGRAAADVAAEFGATPAAVHIACSRVMAALRAELAGLLEED